MFRVFSILFGFESIVRAFVLHHVRTRKHGEQQGKWCSEIPTKPAFFSAPHAVVFALLLLSEADRLLDSPGELLCELVERLVRRQIQAVEARMRLGELRLFARLLDREATGSVGTLEIFETVDGDTRSTSGELQEARLLLGVPATNDL
jgi:hypothetical protein